VTRGFQLIFKGNPGIFFEKTNASESLTSQSLFDQRLKLSPKVFVGLNDAYLCEFYTNHADEVQLFNGHVVLAIDGSDIEIPNTRACIEKYGTKGNAKGGVARASISACYDVLNHYICDGIVDKSGTPEIAMAMNHIDRAGNLVSLYDPIYIMDRNYVSLAFMQYFELNNIKFLCRLKANSHYMEETAAMTTNDEVIEIAHTKNRRQKSRIHRDDLLLAIKSKPCTMVRVVKFPLSSGEIEYLITNIRDFSYEEITSLYNLRWGIETAFYSLKGKLQIEKFTSSVPLLIEQDYFAGVLTYNIIQSAKSSAEKSIDQSIYSYEMRVNENMAIGFVKNELIRIMIEPDLVKRLCMYDAMVEKIARFKVPIRPNRKFPIRFKEDNNNSFNKLKSF